MKITNVFIRFYKSFNFDYLRKYHERTPQKPWEIFESGQWYPFIRIPIEQAVSTVVGANEAGKSQLLSAMEKALTDKGIQAEDFCRYSQFFSWTSV